MYDNIIVDITCRNMRNWGRQALAGYWAPAVAGTVLLMILTLAPMLVFMTLFESDSLETVSNIYSLIVSGPLMLGYYSMIISIFRRKPVSPAEVFYGFEKFGKSFGLYLVTTVLIVFWTLLFVVPGVIAVYRYSLAFLILADNPDIGIMDAIRESKRMMKGNKWKLFTLHLSFIGWMLLSALTFGIGYLFVAPYMAASTVGFYEVANGNLSPQ